MFVEKDVSDEGLPDGTLTPDFYRLARYITGQSVGLVLGGGGARGLAHVGVIETMDKEKVDIDMVGGTSMGAFVGASYCMSTNVEELKQQAALFCKGMNSWWKYLDFALPYVACTSGFYFNKLLKQTFEEATLRRSMDSLFQYYHGYYSFREGGQYVRAIVAVCQGKHVPCSSGAAIV
ncbi:Protein Swiss cheese [Apostichopus japonicus]|uniref:Protein Swiss cheese n=1 Tax=Stichopus japonicus TaxID=307972 RepID=A0A2G8JLC1_STIJA|nr:Protein Swiss cheese [Apostichopus japonicus]